MASRASHYRAKAKHSQRAFGAEKPKPIDDSTWFSAGLVACKRVAGAENRILLYFFALEMDVTSEEADRRLRYLSQLGVLRMQVERDPEGEFVRYWWSLVSPKLPR